jgi:outer membrane immunogenic protein
MRNYSVLLGIIGLFFVPGSAFAQPLSDTWTGAYIGGHAGYGWGTSSGDLGYNDPAFPAFSAKDVFNPVGRSIDTDGAFGGVQGGFNWQSGQFVVGIVADVSRADIGGDGAFVSIDKNTTWHINDQIDWFGTVRGKIGVTSGGFFVYGTGGLAWGHVETSNSVECVGCTTFPWAHGSSNDTQVGWTAGAGVAMKLSAQWSLGVEYLYVDLGDSDHNFVGTALSGTIPVGGGKFDYRSDSFDSDFAFHTVSANLSYHF